MRVKGTYWKGMLPPEAIKTLLEASFSFHYRSIIERICYGRIRGTSKKKG
jgi:hypothetical protein